LFYIFICFIQYIPSKYNCFYHPINSFFSCLSNSLLSKIFNFLLEIQYYQFLN